MNTQAPINKTFLIIILGILAALGPFTIDMYLPGFRQIADDFATDEKHVAFTLTSYFIGIAVGQLIYGPIVDKYGRKKPLLAGLFIYMAAALGCALSPNIETMIAMRLLQALGGCAGMVASVAVITDVYELDKRAKAFSSIVLVMGVAPLIAPSIGSFFVERMHWTYIFYFLVLFSLMVMAMIYFFLPETGKYMHNNKLKVKTISKDYLEILKNRTFFMYIMAASIAMAILFAYITSASFVFLTHYGLDKTTFSLLFAVNASGLITGSYLNGVLTKYVNYIKIARIASVLLSVATLLLLIIITVYPDMPYQWMVTGLFTTLFIIGFINPNATAASLTPFTGNSGSASALTGAVRMGIGALVAAAIGMFQGESPAMIITLVFILAIVSMLLLWLAPVVIKRKKNRRDAEQII